MANVGISLHVMPSYPVDTYTLEEEGIMLPAKNISPVNLTPISLYTRTPFICSKVSLTNLLESNTYSSTYSLTTFLHSLKAVENYYGKAWWWKTEWDNETFKDPAVFIEARFYGINAVISLYDRSKFDGVAIEVTLKPLPSKENQEKGIKVCRFRRDVFLASNCSEYIDYLDGTDIKQSNILHPWGSCVAKRYAKLKRASEFVVSRKNKVQQC
jgi:hypothetical protein